MNKTLGEDENAQMLIKKIDIESRRLTMYVFTSLLHTQSTLKVKADNIQTKLLTCFENTINATKTFRAFVYSLS